MQYDFTKNAQNKKTKAWQRYTLWAKVNKGQGASTVLRRVWDVGDQFCFSASATPERGIRSYL